MPRRTTSVAPAASALPCRTNAVEVVALRRQPQKRQRAVGVARPQPVKRRCGACKRVVQRTGGDAVGADTFRAREVDGLDEWHADQFCAAP